MTFRRSHLPSAAAWSLFLLAAIFLCIAAPQALAAEEFGIVPGSFTATVTNADGTLDTQAGGHPYAAKTSFAFNTNPAGIPDGSLKDIMVDLPPGFIGDPQAVEQCTQAQFQSTTDSSLFTSGCHASSQVGQAEVLLAGDPGDLTAPVYLLAPRPGHPAEFGFHLNVSAGIVPVVVAAGVRSNSDYGLQTVVSNLATGAGSLLIPPVSATLAFWGVPADPRHDPQRGQYCYLNGNGVGIHVIGCVGGGQPSSSPLVPFLTNPTNCESGALSTVLSADSWQDVGVFSTASVSSPEPTGCAQLLFRPSIEATPETTQADAPSGYTISLNVPQQEGSAGLATPELKNATVTLPEGLTVSPAGAGGLEACGDAEINLSSTDAGTCPPASQIGTVKIATPLLASPLEGAVFVGEPECSPCTETDSQQGRLFRLFIQAQGSGVVVKLPGTVSVAPSTGRLSATFQNNPQLPFSSLSVAFKDGPRAPLANPQTCGPAVTTSDLTPWSAPFTPDAMPTSSFTVDGDGAGGACPSSSPFAPGFLAQTSTPAAGAFSPFTLSFSRHDREQDLSSIRVQTPPGLLGMLSSVTLCGEPQASQGTCSPASQIGTTSVAVGSGSHPFVVEGRVYLTVAYGGAPFGLSIVAAAVAGPFNLGNVIVRAAIYVDPHTAALTVISTQLPQIRDGVPLRIQTVDVSLNRPGFIFNPTNCNKQAIDATISSAQGASANVSSPFTAVGCKALPFKPTLNASTNGKVSAKKNGASLVVKVSSTPGNANIHRVDVQLPKLLAARLTTLQKACTEAQFNTNPAACPPASVVGTVTAVTPILPGSLTGPAFLVSHGGAAFPELVIVLQSVIDGGRVTIELNGETDIKNGLTYSKFADIPDAPISSFELRLPEGPNSALAPGGSLCGKSLVMPTTLEAQNGAILNQDTKLTVTGCKRLTTAQKLTMALKACRKRAQKRQASCKAQARRTYGLRSRAAGEPTHKGGRSE